MSALIKIGRRWREHRAARNLNNPRREASRLAESAASGGCAWRRQPPHPQAFVQLMERRARFNMNQSHGVGHTPIGSNLSDGRRSERADVCGQFSSSKPVSLLVLTCSTSPQFDHPLYYVDRLWVGRDCKARPPPAAGSSKASSATARPLRHQRPNGFSTMASSSGSGSTGAGPGASRVVVHVDADSFYSQVRGLRLSWGPSL